MNELVKAAQTGGEKQRQALADALKKDVKRIANWYARYSDYSTVAELESAAWYGVFARIPKVNTDCGSSIAHLIKYARWGVLDYLNKGYKPTEMLIDRDYGVYPPNEIKYATLRLSVESMAEKKKLSKMQRRIIELAMQGLDGEEIGEIVGRTRSAISYQRTEIRNKIGKELL